MLSCRPARVDTVPLCSMCLFNFVYFSFFLPCVSDVLARGTVALDDRKVLRCVLPPVLCYVLLVNKWILRFFYKCFVTSLKGHM